MRYLPNVTCALLLLCCVPLAAFAADDTPADAWIFSGQSNMKAIGGAAQAAVGEVVKGRGHDYLPIYVAESGKPIEAWLEPQHRDYGKLWKPLEEKVKQAQTAGHRFRGFVWYQGESDVNAEAGKYQQQLAELVGRIRKLTGEPDLPAIIVQIGAATSYDGRDWAVGVVREAQRRFAGEDKNAAVVAAIDAEVGDYTVHMSKRGAETIADRIASAADRLAYGNEQAHWGPQFEAAYFLDSERKLVVVAFDNVDDKLQLNDGWLAGFGASVESRLPNRLADLEAAVMIGRLADDYLYPVGGTVLNDHSLMLEFASPLPQTARLSYAAARNAQYGPHRRWGLEFGGLRDGSGHQAPAFVLVPIAEKNAVLTVPKIPQVSGVAENWQQIAVNCVGRYPEAVMAPEAKAGAEQGGWRQAYWNPVSAGATPNLIDNRGRVTPVGFHTGVWYMSPYFRELEDGDDALMASWCKNNIHEFTGLTAGAKYHLAIYLLQGPPKKSDARPAHLPVRVRVLHIAPRQKLRDATAVVEQVVKVPASGTFERYQVAIPSSEAKGNVLLLEDVPADDHGKIALAIEIGQPKGESIKWGDTTLAGVQIRRRP